MPAVNEPEAALKLVFHRGPWPVQHPVPLDKVMN